MAAAVAELIASDHLNVIVGLGSTGLSCARHLAARGRRFAVVDSREAPPRLAEFRTEFPDAELHLGGFDAALLGRADQLVVSPGVSLREPAIAAAIGRGVAVTGDIGLFLEEVTKPVIAITGSNAKSTVTVLTGELVKNAGFRVGVGGNIGTPALELLEAGARDYYVLELSSFQLETLERVNAEVATVLNLSPDHMDRYDSIMDYHRAKHRIFRGCRQVVVNRQDALTEPLVPPDVRRWSFGLDTPDLNEFGLRDHDGATWLAFENQLLMPVADLRIRGNHNVANALAALALGHAIGLPLESMTRTLREFAGLPHRCQWLRERAGVAWYNDSKGTNVGATVAAITGLGEAVEGKLVLIAGGDGKGADFSGLREPCAKHVRAAVLIGRDAGRIAEALRGACDLHRADSMAGAVSQAASIAGPGDAVLLSPACASFDMFRGFEHRGEVFATCVAELD